MSHGKKRWKRNSQETFQSLEENGIEANLKTVIEQERFNRASVLIYDADKMGRKAVWRTTTGHLHNTLKEGTMTDEEIRKAVEVLPVEGVFVTYLTLNLWKFSPETLEWIRENFGKRKPLEEYPDEIVNWLKNYEVEPPAKVTKLYHEKDGAWYLRIKVKGREKYLYVNEIGFYHLRRLRGNFHYCEYVKNPYTLERIYRIKSDFSHEEKWRKRTEELVEKALAEHRPEEESGVDFSP